MLCAVGDFVIIRPFPRAVADFAGMDPVVLLKALEVLQLQRKVRAAGRDLGPDRQRW